jgi:DNA-binding CsgD family transcriptional regulator/GAF domain-containing protein
MDNLPYHMLTDVLEVISAANDSLDDQQVRQKALHALFRTIPAEGAVFFLPDGNGRLTNIILKNLDKVYCNYYKTYYYQFDPLELTNGLDRRKGLDFLEKAFSYDSFKPTEYYNDFLKPQKIHHKLIVNMVAEKELYGRIVLTRSRKSKRFTKNEIRTAKTISPYLAHALAHSDLRKEIRLKGSLLDYIEKRSSIGIILLDEGFRIIYRNDKAEEICDKLKEKRSSLDQSDPIASQLLKDCREIKAGLNSCPAGGMMVPRNSVVKGPNHTRFSLISKALNHGTEWEGSRTFMVSIQEQSPANINLQYLMNTFHLSKREIDVVTLLFLGLKNAQIAGKLFVSEVTVKKHLQNIYDKVGVSNRTTLINRIFTCSGQDVI